MTFIETRNLRAIVDDASYQVSVYKQPNLEVFRDRVNQILYLLYGNGIVDSDKIESITIRDDLLEIDVSYIVRQCHQRDTKSIPMAIIDSDDPAKAANIHRVKMRIEEAEIHRQNLTKTIDESQKKLEMLKNRLEVLKKEEQSLREGKA